VCQIGHEVSCTCVNWCQKSPCVRYRGYHSHHNAIAGWPNSTFTNLDIELSAGPRSPPAPHPLPRRSGKQRRRGPVDSLSETKQMAAAARVTSRKQAFCPTPW
jgi:hypothetical protein